MRIQSVRVKDFRRFTDLTITDVQEEAKLVVLLGPNGCGKSSLFDAFSLVVDHAKTGRQHYEKDHHTKGTDPKPTWGRRKDRIRDRCAKHGMPPPEWMSSAARGVTLTLFAPERETVEAEAVEGAPRLSARTQQPPSKWPACNPASSEVAGHLFRGGATGRP